MEKLLALKSGVLSYLRKQTNHLITMAEHKTDKNGYGVWYCMYCGFTAPQGHWRPKTYIEKHEEHCPKKP